MPQGMPLTIPMTNNIGFQNMAHVVVHFQDAEPDLGRKGFQPDQTRIAEKLAVSATTAFRKRYNLLRKPGSTKQYGAELKLQTWIRDQEAHVREAPLAISGNGLFAPTEVLPILSEPVVEQDVVALFNQMLSSGLVRGVQLISSSQALQYDGLYQIRMEEPYDKYVLGPTNPLGIQKEFFADKDEVVGSITKVLEYKYTLDGLVEEIQAGVKAAEDISLVVVWEKGETWRELYDIVSYLDPDHVHLRTVHGATHGFVDSLSGQPRFDAIVLKDLVSFLLDPVAEAARQRRLQSIE